MASEAPRALKASRALGVALGALLTLSLGARVYHSDEEALAIAFPEATSIEAVTHVLGPEQRERASQLCGGQVRDHLVVIHEARRGAEPIGRALILQEKGKALPFRFLVALTPAGGVDQVLLLAYREPRGHEIERSGFREQYRGKRLQDPIRRGRDIRNITGATISVDSLSRGVRRALALAQVLGETPPPRS